MRIQVTSRARDPKKTLALPECCGDECDAQSRDIRALLPECERTSLARVVVDLNCVSCHVCGANTKTLHFALPHTAAAVVPQVLFGLGVPRPARRPNLFCLPSCDRP